MTCPHCHHLGAGNDGVERYVEISAKIALPYWRMLHSDERIITLSYDNWKILCRIVNAVQYIPETQPYYEYRKMILDINRYEYEDRWEILPRKLSRNI